MKLGYEWLPGNINPNPNWLTSSLQAIYGDLLIGLWIGEDIQATSSGDVFIWPGRVGGTLTPAVSMRSASTVAGRRSATTSDLTVERWYTVSGSTMVAKAWFGVVVIPTLPFANYRVVIGSAAGNGLAGTLSSSTFGLGASANYLNGAATNSVVGLTGTLHTLEADYPTSTDVGVRLGGTSAVSVHNWPEHMALAMCLAAVPTTLQRLQTQLILDTYYRPAQAPAAQLALDLYNILGTDIVGLWIGEDMVLDASNNVTSWPGRVGLSMASASVSQFLLGGSIGSRRSAGGNPTNARNLTVTLPTAYKAVFAVTNTTALPFTNNYETLVNGAATSPLLGGLSGVSTWLVGDWTKYCDGAASSGLITGTHVYSSTYVSSTETTLHVGGQLATGATRNWLGQVGFCMALASVPTTLQRLQVQYILDTYYRPAQASAAKLALDLYGVLEANIIGLWVGEDLVVSGGNVTSWPARVGPTMAAGINPNGVGIINGHQALLPPPLVQNNALVATLSGAKSLIATAVGPVQYPVNGQQGLSFDTNYGINLDVVTNPSGLYVGGGITTYVNGAASTTYNIGSTQVFQADRPSNVDTSIICGGYNAAFTGSWRAPIGCAIALSASPTLLQRLQIQYILDAYYRPDQASASKLALDLYNLFGSNLIGLWIGEDIVFSGTDATSWPGRVGPVLPPTRDGVYRSASTINTRKASTGVSNEFRGFANIATGIVAKTFITASKIPSIPFTELSQCVSAFADVHSIAGNPGTSSLVTGFGWTHLVNGVETDSLAGMGGTVEILEGNNSVNTNTGVRIGCAPNGGAPTGRVWTAEIGTVVALSAVPTTLQRLQAQVLLDTYYRPERWAASKLALDLYNLLGSNLLGLWIGEDIVVDSSNNVTSWPARVGPTLTPIVAGGYRVARTVGSRRSTYTSDTATLGRAYTATLATSKAMISVCGIPPLPFIQFQKALNNSGEDGFVMGTNAATTLYTGAGCSHYVDGVATESAVMSAVLHIVEGNKATPGSANVVLGGWVGGGIPAQNWNADIACAICLADIPTHLQRLQIQYLLDTYYRPAQAPASKLALDLYQVSGLSINGLWVGEDLVLDNSRNVTSWPGRFGPTLSNVTANRFTYAISGSRRQLFTNGTSSKSLSATGGSGSPSIWAVITPSNSIVSGETIADVDISGGVSAPLTRSSTTGVFSTGGDFDSHRVNGAASEVIPTLDHLNVVEATSSLMSPPDYTLGGTNSGGSPWQGGISMGLFLGAIPGASARASALQIIDSYYKVIAPIQQQLTDSLLDIYGSNLIGLWIGEDLVVSGGNVTSWPGRVGPEATPLSTGRFQRSVESGRFFATNSSTAAEAGLSVSIAAPKASICVGRISSLPFADYNALVNWNSGAQVGTAGLSTWHTEVGLVHLTNGAPSETATASLSVFEADLSTNVTTGLVIGGQATYPTRNWLGTIGMVMALGAVPTALQRLQTQLALETYYRPAMVPAAQLALDLYNILGADITGLWIGEDIVASGSNISYWPGRLGPVLMNSGVDPLLKSTLGSRVSTYNDTGIEVGIWATLSAAPQSVFAVIDLTSLPFVDTHVVVGSLAGPENTIVGEYTSTPNWMTDTGYAHYYNGASSELAHTGPGVYEGVKAGVTATDIRVGGFGGDYGGYEFKGKIACVMSLSAIPSAGNRAAVVALLRAYYGF